MAKLSRKQILAELPKGFKCSVSKNGLVIQLVKKLRDIDDFDTVNKEVSKMSKKFKLKEIGTGTLLDTMTRDWELLDTNVEKEMKSEAKLVLASMKKFFNKWGNSYCESEETYKIIDQMRVFVETDEN